MKTQIKRTQMEIEAPKGRVTEIIEEPDQWRFRLRWTNDLHSLFIQAVETLGGLDKATPKNIQRIMKTEGLTLNHIKSHLQRIRNRTKKKFHDHTSTSIEVRCPYEGIGGKDLNDWNDMLQYYLDMLS